MDIFNITNLLWLVMTLKRFFSVPVIEKEKYTWQAMKHHLFLSLAYKNILLISIETLQCSVHLLWLFAYDV
jgi:hypothetical protein